jgi:hypothetical protein
MNGLRSRHGNVRSRRGAGSSSVFNFANRKLGSSCRSLAVHHFGSATSMTNVSGTIAGRGCG